MNGKGIAVILVVMFAVALGAGAVAGKLSVRLPHNVTAPTEGGTLSQVLQLTPAQNSQMQQIWEGVRKTSDDCINEAKGIQVQEDKELMENILTSKEQKDQFQALRERSQQKLAELARKRDVAFKKAIEDTKPILNAEQWKTYEKILRDRTGGLPDATGGRSSGDWDLHDTARVSR